MEEQKETGVLLCLYVRERERDREREGGGGGGGGGGEGGIVPRRGAILKNC